MNDNIKTMNSDSITTFKKAEKWTTATVPTATKKKMLEKLFDTLPQFRTTQLVTYTE